MKPLDPLALPLTGTALIEASAGTGKTHTITTLVLRLLLERELEIGQILVVTYTRAATFELRERVRARLLAGLALLAGRGLVRDEDEELQVLFAARTAHAAQDRRALGRALRDFDQAAIFTIHGFCQRVLAEHAFESAAPFEIELNEDEQPLLREIALDYYALVAYQADPQLVGMLDAQRVLPSSLSELARATASDPGLGVLPELSGPPPVLALERVRAAQQRTAEAWHAGRARLLGALTSGALHGGRYKSHTILKTWASQLDGLATCLPSALPECLSKLTPDALRSALKQGQQFPLADPFFAAAAELSAAADELAQLGEAHALHVKRGLVDYARSELARRRDAIGTRGFDDLLQRLDQALGAPSGERLQQLLAERYPAALIDEFQDTDPVQYRIFRRCYRAPGQSLFLIGDPKQAIYGFRGADVFAYLEAARDADESRYTLNVNRRSDPALLTALNALWTRGPEPFLLSQIRYQPVRTVAGARDRLSGDGAALQLLLLPAGGDKAISKGRAEARLPRLIAAEVSQLLASNALLDGRKVLPRDVAVLCRTNVQARATQDALAELGIPTVLDGDSNVLESETADELSQVLWAVAAPSDGRKLGAALISTLLGVDAAALERLRSSGEGEQDWLERFAAWNQLWHTRGFMPMFHALLDDAEVRARLLARSGGERRLTDLLHLGELLHDAATRQHLGPLALLQWLGEMRSDRGKRAELASESAQVRLEHDEHALRVATIHRSKGLEYPIVFAPFLWTTFAQRDLPRFHDPADHFARKLDLGSSQLADHKAIARDEELAEALRIAYVAVTRAKHRCYLVWGRFTQGGHSPLGYLLHHDQRLREPAAVDGMLKELKSDAALRGELERLVPRAEGTLELRAIREQALPYRAEEPARAELLSARTATRQHSAEPRATSFSRLTAEPEVQVAPGEVGPDVDAHAPAELATAVPAARPLALHLLPAGPGPGTLLHGVYERIDFRRGDRDELPREAARALKAFGLDSAALQDGVVQGIDESLRTVLDVRDPSLTLASVAPEARLNELEFTLCTPEAAQRLSAARLATVFERAAIGARIPDYAERVRALPNALPAQFVKGFIDLVFRHAGRWYVADYKSNMLGLEPGAYAQPALERAMAEHHYVLQYHLYALALQRYLRLRLPGYEHERDFGGVYYLFLRGMAPEHAAGTGVFFDRPSLATLDQLGAALGTAERAS